MFTGINVFILYAVAWRYYRVIINNKRDRHYGVSKLTASKSSRKLLFVRPNLAVRQTQKRGNTTTTEVIVAIISGFVHENHKALRDSIMSKENAIDIQYALPQCF